MLGQHEMGDEVLSVDIYDCVARYLLSTYFSSPVKQRAKDVLGATERAHSVGAAVEPVRDMERAYGRALPELDVFLDGWISCLEASPDRGGEWPSEHDRWLREAVTRRDGAPGLARLARDSKQPDTLRAWCDALAQSGDWQAALDAFEEAASLATQPLWRGEFLDGAALAAAQLGRKDATKKLEAAWTRAPSLPRLVRWLMAGDADAKTIRKRAADTLKKPPTKAPSLLGLLHILDGDAGVAAKLLGAAPGLGWSDAEHPGHLLFPTFVWLLTGPPSTAAAAKLVARLRDRPRSLLDFDVGDLNEAADSERVPRAVAAGPVIGVLERAEARDLLTAQQRPLVIDALKRAAAKRTEGVTSAKRRSHYGHAALLVACVEEVGGAPMAAWVEDLRKQTSRFHAFQEELRGARAGNVDRKTTPRHRW